MENTLLYTLLQIYTYDSELSFADTSNYRFIVKKNLLINGWYDDIKMNRKQCT
jgi:hypothetical protein